MLRTIAFVLITVFALAGCTLNKQIRKAEVAAPACDYTANPVSESCRNASIEDHGDYLLSVVEFDDQGWFRDRRQQQLLFEKLDALGDQDAIIVTFVHGWKHNADYCDSNMCCFRDMLQQISRLDEAYSTPETRRKVVGVYVGWRGLSLTGGEVWENLSFWTRKETATRVALGSTRELLVRLRNFYQSKQPKDGERKDEAVLSTSAQASQPASGTRLITVGHSFGGLIVYSAIAQSLVNSGVERVNRTNQEEKPIKAFGDLVVLVNPAVEGARYEPVYSVHQGRRDFLPNQTPVFVTVTSADDQATRLAFPLGRTLSSMLESYSASAPDESGGYEHSEKDEKQADRNTIGHVDRYMTHTLLPIEKADSPATPRKDTQPCTCPYADEIKKITAEKILQERQERNNLFCRWTKEKGRKPGWERPYGDQVMLKHQHGPVASPFWVVKTQAPIIPNHNEFYTPLFINFLRGLYDDVLSGREFKCSDSIDK